MDEDPKTEELRVTQAGREDDERARAKTAEDPEQAAEHGRRAAKAAYLRRKLEERAMAEREAGEKPR